MASELTDITGIGPATVPLLNQYGFISVNDIATTEIETLIKIPGFSYLRAAAIIESAQSLCADDLSIAMTAEVMPIILDAEQDKKQKANTKKDKKINSKKKASKSSKSKKDKKNKKSEKDKKTKKAKKK